MVKPVRHAVILLILLMLISPLICFKASADGFSSVYPSSDSQSSPSEWIDLDEGYQFALINYHPGSQKMILSVGVRDSLLVDAEKAFWIFPLPCHAANVDINVIQSSHILKGYDIKNPAKNSLRNNAELLFSSQIFPLPFFLTNNDSGLPVVLEGPSYLKQVRQNYSWWSLSGGEEYSVEVVSEFNMYGLTTQSVEAETGSGLRDYMNSMGFDLSDDFLFTFEEYIQGGYSFVLSWVDDIEEFRQNSDLLLVNNLNYRSLGVYVCFPTQKIFFPMKLTSLYDDDEIPITIQAIGHITLDQFNLQEDLIENITVQYRYADAYLVPVDLTMFFESEIAANQNNLRLPRIYFTEISIQNVEAKYFTEDLWFFPTPPLNVTIANTLISSPLVLLLPFFAIFSSISGFASGWLIFRKNSPQLWKFAIFGLGNFLTIIFIYIFARVVGLKRFLRKPQAVEVAIYPEKFVFAYIIIFIGLMSAFYIIIENSL
ncbi:MAG: hypothetical protein OEV21_06215 [Thermoplasmata archaeon]|nr:hypothetical protein [Thermoplasmata archaeon]